MSELEKQIDNKKKKTKYLGLLLGASLAFGTNKTANNPKLTSSSPLPASLSNTIDTSSNNIKNVYDDVIHSQEEEKERIDISSRSLRIVDSFNPLSHDAIQREILPNLTNVKEYSNNIWVLNENIMLDRLCLEDLSALFDSIHKENISLYIKSGFRSMEQQEIAYSQATNKSAVALPGTSQHHTGLAIDFTTPEINNVIDINANFSETKAGSWLLEHAWEYGFVLSYTNNHDGLANEDWHYFYVGKDLAEIWRDYQIEGEKHMDLFTLQEMYSDYNREESKPLWNPPEQY